MRRFVTYVCCVLVIVTLEMMAVAYAGWRWSVPVVLVIALLLGAPPSWRPVRRLPAGAGRMPADRPAGSRRSEIFILAILAILLLVWLAIGGAATSFDLLLFWGTKGQQFALAHTIDVPFLADPAHHVMQPDYPPLVPLLYACTMIGADRLHWFAPVLTAPIFLALAACSIFAFRRSAELATIFATMFGFLFALNYIGGNAEPALIFFETVALVADDDLLATAALTGAVLTKLEGAVFAALFILVVTIWRRRPALLLRLGALPAMALGSWIIFTRVHHLASVYAGTVYGPFSLAHLGGIARVLLHEASFDVACIPWIVALIVLALSRRAVPPLIMAAGFIVFLLFAYSRASDMTPLVLFSAKRVLLTPLLLILLGGNAAYFADAPSRAGEHRPDEGAPRVAGDGGLRGAAG